MEPDFTWKLTLLIAGIALPSALIAADLLWWGANAIVVICCLAWSGFLFFAVEGLTE